MKELIDEKDLKILGILEKNSSLSTHKISKQTLIPVTTINNRIKKLKELGVIKRFTIEVDKRKLGYNLEAYIYISKSLGETKRKGDSMKDLLIKIRKDPFVESAHYVTGEMDMVIKISVKGIDELNDYVANTLPYYTGVEKTRTALILTPK